MSDRQLRQTMGAAAMRKAAVSYDVEVIARRWEDLLENLLATKVTRD